MTQQQALIGNVKADVIDLIEVDRVICAPLDLLIDIYRGIAQSGSAPALGAGCREFKSLYPDQSVC